MMMRLLHFESETRIWNLASPKSRPRHPESCMHVMRKRSRYLYSYSFLRLRPILTDDQLLFLILSLSVPNSSGHEKKIQTNRTSKKVLPLPKEEDVFHFVIYGDRTGGPDEGIKVLEQAVKDTNLLDPDLGFTPHSFVEIVELNIRYEGQYKKAKIHEFDIVEVMSVSSHDRMKSPLSWRGGGGWVSPEDIQCNGCRALRGYLGLGASKYLDPENQNFLAFGFGNANMQVGKRFKDKFRIGPSLMAGLWTRIDSMKKLLFEAETRYFPNQESIRHSRKR